MPVWLIGVLEWAVEQLLSNINTQTAKDGLAAILMSIDAMVQGAVANASGPLAVLEKDAALAFDTSVKAIVAALKA